MHPWDACLQLRDICFVSCVEWRVEVYRDILLSQLSSFSQVQITWWVCKLVFRYTLNITCFNKHPIQWERPHHIKACEKMVRCIISVTQKGILCSGIYRYRCTVCLMTGNTYGYWLSSSFPHCLQFPLSLNNHKNEVLLWLETPKMLSKSEQGCMH